MPAKLRSWWPKIKQYRVAIGVVVIALVTVIALIIAVHWFGWDWTGFTSVTGPTLKPNKQYRPAKTLWDWLQLLIIPAVLAVGGYLYNYTTSKTEREVASDRLREEALQAYVDRMSELLLHEKLSESQLLDEVRRIARVQTLTVLPRLDSLRKKSVLLFLDEAGLIKKYEPIVSLDRADLRGADLRGTDLRGVVLSGADLSGADLSGADLGFDAPSEAYIGYADLKHTNLSEANLSGANLSRAELGHAILWGAVLSGANLSKADLKDAIGITIKELERQTASLKGAIMPDGSIHT